MHPLLLLALILAAFLASLLLVRGGWTRHAPRPDGRALKKEHEHLWVRDDFAGFYCARCGEWVDV